MLLPLFSALTLALVLALTSIAFIYIFSVGKLDTKSFTPFAIYDRPPVIDAGVVFALFMMVWLQFLVSAGFQYLLSGTVVAWYHSNPRPFRTSIHQLFRYHLGSISLGSFLLSLLMLIRFIAALIEGASKAEGNRLAQAVAACVGCCARCCQKMLEWFNELAYTYIAISGGNFIESSSRAWQAVTNNPLKVGVSTLSSRLVAIMGVLFICSLTLGLTYLLAAYTDYYRIRLTSPALICAVVAFFTLLLASFFFSVFGGTATAMMLCFIQN
jgi:solute carrier family 44 protein 1 (choline transporter-like protein)